MGTLWTNFNAAHVVSLISLAQFVFFFFSFYQTLLPENFNEHHFPLRKAASYDPNYYQSLGPHVRAQRHKKSSSRGGYARAGQSTQSSEGEESVEDKHLGILQRRPQDFSSSYQRSENFGGLHRSTSLSLLPRSLSQESLPEEGDPNEENLRWGLAEKMSESKTKLL